ncbi:MULTISPECIES: GNAT family N-acetyltransferase [Bacillus]|uniref:N-acetyltransferase n=2 Tax=Bacillus cereus group TaxID=86661 RepID=A0A2A7DA06_BACAN|nr:MULTISPECIES: GNAT family N-acetyltransferase [Bacillus]MCP1163852.1 GNAT family N-acetyltransferase [Bacillus sp. 1813sda1]MDC7975236.1 GNAT family N-acetyltransferase [Bacillus sp. BLCC-B18]OTW71579.1 GNAT family N-acetyltransferase [Bacillus thuringiensis serovar coreanensis]OTX55199.1 GNAT family N-acetyltransferase [Bacillus thuringiensis serovar sooncheon]OTX58536.1 GNAT family N-acetyltransferase [Bacillus thuringiensis serovar guiyangiensis]
MNVQLKVVTRENWEDALKLQVKENQTKFVPSVAVSLAKVYIKPDGDNVEYIPFAIYDDNLLVGFIMHAVVRETTDMYWINGFIVDQMQQGNGYGKAALQKSIYLIKNTYKACKEIRLTVHKDNIFAKKLYERAGFQSLGHDYDGEQVYRLFV